MLFIAGWMRLSYVHSGGEEVQSISLVFALGGLNSGLMLILSREFGRRIRGATRLYKLTTSQVNYKRSTSQSALSLSRSDAISSSWGNNHPIDSEIKSRRYVHNCYIIVLLNYLLKARGRSLLKLGLPRPVTGSQPAVAFQLAYGTTGLPLGEPPKRLSPSQPVLPPTTISLNPRLALLYSQGLRNPSGGWCARRRASFKRPMMPPNIGDEHEVPAY